jgi:hypothetical protein
MLTPFFLPPTGVSPTLQNLSNGWQPWGKILQCQPSSLMQKAIKVSSDSTCKTAMRPVTMDSEGNNSQQWSYVWYFTSLIWPTTCFHFTKYSYNLIGSSLICHHGLLTSQGPPTAGVHSHLTTLKHNSGGSTIVFAETPKLSSLVKSTV